MIPENDRERAMAADPDAAAASDDTPAMPDGGTDGLEATAKPVTADVQAYIGRQLRAVYDDVVKQPIPDRFLALMKQLEEQGPGS